MRRTLVMALLLAIVALLLGVFVTSRTFPSDEEIQRKSFAQLGLDPNLVDQPFVQMILQQTVGPVRKTVVDESRQSMLLGAASTVAVMVVGVGLIATDHRRRGHVEVATPADEVAASP